MSPLGRAFVCLTVIASSLAIAQERWLSEEQVGEWNEVLENESTGNNSARTVFSPVGFLIGLSGHYPITDWESPTVASWLEDHREVLGVQGGEEFDCASVEPFVEPISINGESIETAQTGLIYNCGVTIDGITSDPKTVRVIVDTTSDAVVRGLVNSFYPTINGNITAEPWFSEEDAWNTVESDYAITSRRAATRQWTSVDWIEHRLPAQKEYLWLLSGEVDGDGIRSFVVSPASGVVYVTDSMSWFGEKGQEHFGFTETGSLYWNSAAPSSGCVVPSASCVNPALTDSLSLRDTFPLVLESWVNLSSQTGDPFDWPWTATPKSPLKSAANLDGRKIKAILAHGNSTMYGDCGLQPPPCSRYPIIWFGPNFVAPDLQGHELGHFFLDDLKLSVSRIQDRASAVFSEVFSDFVGITTEDFMLRIAQPDPLIGPRTDFKVTSGAATINWATASTNCLSTNPLSKRVAVGGALYRGWNGYRTNYSASYRDAAISIWRRSFFNALYLTTDVAPTSLDLYAGFTAVTTPPQFIVNNRPPPSNFVQAQMAGLSSACW